VLAVRRAGREPPVAKHSGILDCDLEEAEQLVRRAFDAFARRDVDGLVALASEDVEFFPIGTSTLARAGEPYRGHEGVRLYFEDVGAVWEEIEPVPHSYRTHGDHVIVRGRIYARAHDGLLIDAPVVWIWRVQRDRIVWFCATSDEDEALQAAGISS
jgi:ketosteroid isomerase-like protein